jgi:hypothetical protein
LTERWATLSRFPFPALDAAALASLMRWAMAAIATALFLWWMSGIVRRWEGMDPDSSRTADGADAQILTPDS